MSPPRISLSPDLQKLRDEGYEVEINHGYLLIRNVPYVRPDRSVARASLISELTLGGEVSVRPSTHVINFCGDEAPCDANGSPINHLVADSVQQELAPGLVKRFTFSSKPPEGYGNYYDKVTTYVNILSAPAESISPSTTARTYAPYAAEGDSVFQYEDTASSRAGIVSVSNKLACEKVAIIGLGGTGSYVLDLVAKCPVAEIHLFDSDQFLQHNAFRAPGAPSLEELKLTSSKVHYFAERYSKMHRRIFPHPFNLDLNNTAEIQSMTFAFICVDKGAAKKPIVETLEAGGLSFIDVGMGVNLVDNQLLGMIRVTSSTNEKRNHVRESHRISFADEPDDNHDAYHRNIQIADLNALNAALAVVKWKKLRRLYQDLEGEHFSTYSTNVNLLTSDDPA